MEITHLKSKLCTPDLGLTWAILVGFGLSSSSSRAAMLLPLLKFACVFYSVPPPSLWLDVCACDLGGAELRTPPPPTA